MPVRPGVLFTAFEPSGDALAAPVIRRLHQLRPDLPIHALGGPRMREAGATIIEESTQHAAMLLGAIGKIGEHWQRVGRLKRWLADNPIAALAPVDSPAANWSICAAVRRAQPSAVVVHLCAPQLWAWAPWRIGKMRRLSNHVLCLLPFEPDWFSSRGVSATFVGHPLFETPAGERAAAQSAKAIVQGASTAALPHPSPRLALLPGSRPAEWRRNWPTMLRAVAQLRSRHPGMTIAVAASDQLAQQSLIELARHESFSDLLDIRIDQTDAIIAWADAVLVVSGTATLQVASHHKPMVALYNVNRWSWELLGRWLVKTRTFTLPNLIAEHLGPGRAITELVPHFGEVTPVAQALDAILSDPAAAARQRELLAQVCAPFAGTRFSEAAADKLIDIANI